MLSSMRSRACWARSSIWARGTSRSAMAAFRMLIAVTSTWQAAIGAACMGARNRHVRLMGRRSRHAVPVARRVIAPPAIPASCGPSPNLATGWAGRPEATATRRASYRSIAELRAAGISSASGIARALTERGIPTAQGSPRGTSTAVQRVLNRPARRPRPAALGRLRQGLLGDPARASSLGRHACASVAAVSPPVGSALSARPQSHRPGVRRSRADTCPEAQISAAVWCSNSA